MAVLEYEMKCLNGASGCTQLQLTYVSGTAKLPNNLRLELLYYPRIFVSKSSNGDMLSCLSLLDMPLCPLSWCVDKMEPP